MTSSFDEDLELEITSQKLIEFVFFSISAGVIWLIAILLYIYKILIPLCDIKCEDKREITLSTVQAVLLIISLHNIYVQSKRFDEGTPVSYFYQTLSWLTAGNRRMFAICRY